MAVATSISRSCSLHSGTACEAWSLGLSSFGFALSVKLPAVGSRWKPWNADPMGPMGPMESAPWNPAWTPWNPSNLPCTESCGCSMGGLICIASQEKLPVGNICPRSPSSLERDAAQRRSRSSMEDDINIVGALSLSL